MLSQFHFILVGFHQPYTLTISTTSSAAASSSSSFLPFRNQSKQSHTIVCVLIPCSASHTRYFRKQTINFKLLQHTQICAHIFHGFRPPLLHADTCTHTYGTETQNLFIINARIKGEQTQNILFFFLLHPERTNERWQARSTTTTRKKKTLVKSISVLFSSSQCKKVVQSHSHRACTE